MTEEKITHYFQIDRISSESLHAQLKKRLAVFIETHLAGTVLPAERRLASTLGISRVTVRNALREFLDDGRLVSTGRNGTRIAKRKLEFKDIDLLAIGLTPPPNPVHTLRFFCHENLPGQRLFWDRVIHNYNEAHRDWKIQVDFVETKDFSAYSDFDNVDLFLMQPGFEPHIHQLARPFSKNFRHPCHSPEFLQELLPPNEDWKYMVPLDFSFPAIIWNRELADRCGFHSLRHELMERGLWKITEEAERRLPAPILIGDHIWDHLFYCGVPEEADKVPEHLLPVLKEIASFPRVERTFYTSQTHSLDMVENFWNGKQLFSDIHTNFFNISGPPSFEYEIFPYPVHPGYQRIIYPLHACISNRCLIPEAAENFLEYLLSSEVQPLFSEVKSVAPIRRDACFKYMKKFYGMTPPEAESCLRGASFPIGKLAYASSFSKFVIFYIRPEICQVLKHEQRPEDILEVIRQKWRIFQSRKFVTNSLFSPPKTDFKKGKLQTVSI